MRNKLKGIHFGSYWMGKNDVVYLMSRELKYLCDLILINTSIYSRKKSNWYTEDYSHSKIRPIRWLDDFKVLELIKKKKPDFIIVNSGGMSLTQETIRKLKGFNIIIIGISLSDPDVFYENGKIYAKYYDLFYTNSQFALDNLYPKGETNIKLLPFAASPRFHRPLGHINKVYDVVVIGHARPERVHIVRKLKKYFTIGLFGSGWGKEYRSVHGEEHVRAINSGKIYLSFSQTVGGYKNVKVGIFEAVACKSCVVTQMFNEIESYFKYGIDILGYTNSDMLIDLITTYSKNAKLRNWISNNGYNRLLNEHTWEKRWGGILNDIRKIQYEKYGI